MKKVGKTTRPFRYDLNKIPNNYAVVVTNRFCLRREEKLKAKGEKERYIHLKSEFQKRAKRDKKAFLSDQCKETEETNRFPGGSDHELPIAKFRLKLKKVGKITRPFRYDLNQIPYDYTVEVRNRFKGLDRSDRESA